MEERERVVLSADDIAEIDAATLLGTATTADGSVDWAEQAKRADWKGNPDGTPRVVECSVVMVGSGELAGDPRRRAKRIEAAMAAAVEQCLAEGIGMDKPDLVRARMMAARELARLEG